LTHPSHGARSSAHFFHQKALKQVTSKLVKPYHFRAGL
jgi:hypothetical protein